MTTVPSELPGELICSTRALPPKSIPSWGMYLISAFCSVNAGVFVVVAVDAFMSPLRGTAQAGAAAIVIGLILLGCGIAAFVSGWKTKKARDVRFHSRGVIFKSGGDETFVPYADVAEIKFQLIVPSSEDKAKSLARGVISLAAGNAAGVGYAIASTLSSGLVQLKLTNEKEAFVFQFDLETTKRLADEVSNNCEHAVIS